MNTKYILSGLASYLIWGFVPVVFRNLKGNDNYEVITYRFLFAAIIMAIVLSFRFKEHKKNIVELHKCDPSFIRRTYILTAFGGLMMAVNTLSYIYVINNITVNAGAFAYLILPIVTAFLAFFLLKEKLSKLKWLGIFLGSVSCVLIGNVNLDQLIYISGVTFSYAFYLVSQKKNPFFNRRLLLTIQLFVGAIVLVSINPVTVDGKTAEYWVNILALAGVFTVTAMLLNLFALKGIESSQLAFMIYLNPIASFVLGITVYNEVIGKTESIAFFLLLVAIICFNWSLIKQLFYRREVRTS